MISRVHHALPKQLQIASAVLLSPFPPQCRYIYRISKTQFTPSDSIDDMIHKLDVMTTKKEVIPLDCIEQLKKRLASENYTSDQAMHILSYCTPASYDKNHDLVVHTIWTEISKRSHILNAVHYKLMLRYYSEVGNPSGAQAMFDRLGKIIRPLNRYPYQWLMGAYARVGDVKKVYQLRRLQRMHSLDKGMDDKAYNYCVLSHLKAGDINGANTALAELRKEGCCMHRCVQHALLEFHAKSGNMLEINQVLDRCKDEQTEDHGKAILFVINELARNGLSSNIDSLLLLLPSIYQLDEAIRSAIPQFVEQNRSLLMVKILMESGVDLRIHIKHLFKEMVYHEVSSDEFDSVWDKLNSIGFSIDSHFQFYEPALHSKSIKLIEAILNHMHLEQMSIDKETVKTWIKLSREKGPQYFLSTAQLIIAVYKVDPESKLGQDMVFSGYNWSTDPIGLLAHMLHFHIGSRDIVFALIEAILNENNIETAIQIIEKYVYDYDNDNIKTLLLEAYFQTRDVPNFVRFINLVRKYRLMKSWKKVDAIQIMQMRYDLTDELVQQIVVDERMDIELLSTTLQTMRNNGLFISRQCFNKIAAVIGRSGESSRILSLLEAMSTKNPI